MLRTQRGFGPGRRSDSGGGPGSLPPLLATLPPAIPCFLFNSSCRQLGAVLMITSTEATRRCFTERGAETGGLTLMLHQPTDSPKFQKQKQPKYILRSKYLIAFSTRNTTPIHFIVLGNITAKILPSQTLILLARGLSTVKPIAF